MTNLELQQTIIKLENQVRSQQNKIHRLKSKVEWKTLMIRGLKKLNYISKEEFVEVRDNSFYEVYSSPFEYQK